MAYFDKSANLCNHIDNLETSVVSLCDGEVRIDTQSIKKSGVINTVS